MLEYLFGSKTRLKLLQIFFREPDARFFVRELVRLSDTQINAVRRELAILSQVGIIVGEGNEEEDRKTRRKFYRLNPESLLFEELQALLVKSQLMGERAFVDQLKGLGNITFLLLSGRFVGEPELPTDILLVGSVSDKSMKQLVKRFEKKLGFEIRYTLMSQPEFVERKRYVDRFLYELFEGKHEKVVDNLT